jgi:Arc/MetJ-type ribon-helix-helix transcriptional regulator
MTRLPLIVTVRLDETTRSRIMERVGPDRRLKSFSEFVREAIAIRLEQTDPFLGWSVRR